MNLDTLETMVGMNAKECKAVEDKAARLERDGTETGRLKGAYIRAVSTALSTGRARKLLRAAGVAVNPKYERDYQEACEDMRVTKALLAKRGVHVKDTKA